MTQSHWMADGRQIVWTTPMQVDIVGVEVDALPADVLGELRFRTVPDLGVVEFIGAVRIGTSWDQMKAFITWVDQAYANLAARPDPQALGWDLAPPETGWQWMMEARLA